VLVVDDNADAADSLVDLLTDLGYLARASYDAVTALDQARDLRPDIGLLDIGLPVMDGYELASRLRDALSGWPLTLIAVTGYGQDADRRRAREAGFDAHLVKPVNLEALEQALAPGAAADGRKM
jgi:CheY-like chemotaxis protein